LSLRCTMSQPSTGLTPASASPGWRTAHSRRRLPTGSTASAPVETHPLDDAVGSLGEARRHETGVAAGRIPGDAVRLQHHHAPAAAGKLTRAVVRPASPPPITQASTSRS
jgi:hypothetical protein